MGLGHLDNEQKMLYRLGRYFAEHPFFHLPSSKRASVAIILRSSAPAAPLCAASAEVLYIKRASREGDPWSGHVAFPGGKREGSESDMECAERETREEVGLDLRDRDCFRFLGRLDDRPVLTGGRALADSAFCVGVYLQLSPTTPPLTLQPGEVAETRWVPMSHLLPGAVDRRGVARPAERFLPTWLHSALGAQRIYLPAIALPPEPGSASRTPFLLWGMSLQATSDLVLAAGAADTPLSWPPAAGDTAAAKFLVAAYCGAAELAALLQAGRRSKQVGALQLQHVGALGAVGALLGSTLLAARQLVLALL